MLSPSVLIILASLFSWFGVNWESVDARIEQEFPGIAFVGQEELAESLAASVGARPVLVDVREAEEFAVSHLEAAANLQTAAAIAARVPDKSTPLVVYCSVGYRSAEVAAELQALGYGNVRNLRHSIFAWASAGRPLVNVGGATDKVHPFNATWGSLIDSTLHSYSPVSP